jgi:hypothetical protein
LFRAAAVAARNFQSLLPLNAREPIRRPGRLEVLSFSGVENALGAAATGPTQTIGQPAGAAQRSSSTAILYGDFPSTLPLGQDLLQFFLQVTLDVASIL